MVTRLGAPYIRTSSNGNKMNYKEEIKKWLYDHRDEMVDDICSMVRVPSVLDEACGDYPFGENCFRALEKAMEIASRCGLETENFRNMVGQASLRKGHADFGIWAHSDVVPVDGVWTNPPFDPIVKDGRIYGRGTTDNKGQLVASLYALRCLRELGIELKHNVAVFVGTKEETGMEDIKAWLAENEEPFFNLAPDADYAIGYAEKCSLRFDMSAPLVQKGLLSLYGGSAPNVFPKEVTAVLKLSEIEERALAGLDGIECTKDAETVTLTARGKGGHSAKAPGVDNPFPRLIGALDAAGVFPEGFAPQLKCIAEACLDESGNALDIACSDDVVGKLHFSGTMLSLEDGILNLVCDVRYPGSCSAETLIERIRNKTEALGFSLEIRESDGSVYSDPNEPGAVLCARLSNELAPEFGLKQYGNYILNGGTYARHFTRGYAFGMNAGENAHNVDESVSIDRLIFGALVYALCIIELDELY